LDLETRLVLLLCLNCAEDGSLFTFGQNDWGQLGHSARDKFIAVSWPSYVQHVAPNVLLHAFFFSSPTATAVVCKTETLSISPVMCYNPDQKLKE